MTSATTEGLSGHQNSRRQKHASRSGLAWSVYCIFALALLLGTLWLAGGYGRQQAALRLDARTRNTATLNAVVLRTVLEKQRSLPFVLSEDRDVNKALASGDQALFRALDLKLETLAGGTNASVIYILDKDGMTVAASNWREPTSFVGNSYAFRPYYRDAMATARAEYYALGTSSRLPGLYISRRVDGPEGIVGVVVVKVQFDQVETDWRNAAEVSYVSDRRGVVLITSIPQWRFMTLTPIAGPVQATIRESLQFGAAPLQPLPLSTPAGGDRPDLVEAVLPGAPSSASFVRVGVPVPTTNWTLNVLAPAERDMAVGARDARSLGILGLMPLLAAAAWLLYRRQHLLEREAENWAARAELERRVSERTAELSTANALLQSEVDERKKAVTRLQEVREELAQANRLAILGQVTAGVTHEINQPVAAIRSFADNARILLRRHDARAAEDNLGAIASLTERIGTITEGLRAFSRKGTGGVGPTGIAEAFDGVFLLLNNRLKQQGVELVCTMPPSSLRVMGNRVRLEQVLVNLVQNAMEALEERVDGQVELGWGHDGEWTLITVADNGPGIPGKVMERLFTPFTTTKTRGLGLGHVICHDIVTEFGGRLAVESEPGRGTRFTIRLRSVE
ncbi:ATP-binding protein [Microvirga sp. VF16]|uniref:sensor histidine kinase n=1 Tax=Microvirga sp. VF16 TaxID=2807101 RepID=UPI00193EA704|nr:ATP-binding protein [Microvirga sp. VF16]QRM32680.1 sensor histidine kinase [Microvirga sp. VF16]